MKATAIWLRMAFSLHPMKRVMLRFCLIHLKNSSICQRRFVEGSDFLCGTDQIVGEQPQDLACVDADGDLAPRLMEWVAPAGGQPLGQMTDLVGQYAAIGDDIARTLASRST